MAQNAFKDHFSNHASDYQRYRPTYPAALFRALAAVAPDREWAWDCATGNGQAALGLAEHFHHVEATDASAQQIAAAQPHPNVHYSVAPAEASGLPEHRASLITVAQALHWFDASRFYDEARRVAKPGAVLACWSYGRCTVSPGVDAATERLYSGILGDAYWPPERKHVETGYRDLPFPFTEMELPVFHMQVQWDLGAYVGYLRSWSATQAFVKRNSRDPLAEIEEELTAGWGVPERPQTVRWPLSMRAGWVS